MRDYVIIDVETSNYNRSSICQIGLVKVVDGEISEKHSILVNPLESFYGKFTEIHGISLKDVKGAPTYTDIHTFIFNFLNGQVVVSHTDFDPLALDAVCDKYTLPFPKCTWLNSEKVANQIFANHHLVAKDGRASLKDVSLILKINFKHHDALSDAIMLIEIIKRCDDTQLLNEAIYSPRIEGIYKPKYATDKRNGKQDGIFTGKKIVFTGKFDKPRNELANIAANLGFDVPSGLSKKVDFLVWDGKIKSSKIINAKKWNVSIITEHEFMNMK